LEWLFPSCNVLNPSLLGNGICDNYGMYNTKECGNDGGDCREFNLMYPKCQSPYPFSLGDGDCYNDENSGPECNFDGGDCVNKTAFPHCNVTATPLMSRGYCNDECGYTTNCTYFADEYPDCNATDLSLIGNGVCDHSEYNVAECGYEDYDCVAVTTDCKVEYSVMIGDGTCDDSLKEGYNKEECGWDGGDCIRYNAEWPAFQENFPNCTAIYPAFLFDGICVLDMIDQYDNEYIQTKLRAYNTSECGYDNGDCL